MCVHRKIFFQTNLSGCVCSSYFTSKLLNEKIMPWYACKVRFFHFKYSWVIQLYNALDQDFGIVFRNVQSYNCITIPIVKIKYFASLLVKSMLSHKINQKQLSNSKFLLIWKNYTNLKFPVSRKSESIFISVRWYCELLLLFK